MRGMRILWWRRRFRLARTSSTPNCCALILSGAEMAVREFARLCGGLGRTIMVDIFLRARACWFLRSAAHSGRFECLTRSVGNVQEMEVLLSLLILDDALVWWLLLPGLECIDCGRINLGVEGPISSAECFQIGLDR